MGLEKNSSTKRLPRITLWNVFETRLRQLPLTLCWPNFLLPKVSWIPRFVGKNRVNTNIFAGHTYIYTRKLYNIIYIHVCYIIIYICISICIYILLSHVALLVNLSVIGCFIQHTRVDATWRWAPAHSSPSSDSSHPFGPWAPGGSVWFQRSSHEILGLWVFLKMVSIIYIYVYVYYMNIKYTHLVYIHIIYTQFLAIWYDLLGGF
jgi:hypothetical protein